MTLCKNYTEIPKTGFAKANATLRALNGGILKLFG